MTGIADLVTRLGTAMAAAVLVAVALVLVGVPETLGAQPLWAQSVGYMGLAVAVPVLLIAVLRPVAMTWAALAAIVCGGIAAWFGKAAFVASYAEDALAGRAWYLGWIVLCGGLAALVGVIVLRMRAARV